MPLRALAPSIVIVAVANSLLAKAALAQTPNRNEGVAAAAVSGIYQSDADLEGGGNAGSAGLILNGSYSKPITPQFGFGFTLRYDYENWRFSNPVAFGGTSPWKNINALALGVTFDYAYASDLRLGISPVFGWSYETGAGTSNVLDYGAVLSATKVFSPQLMLGGGVSVVRQIDETKVFPFVVLRWQIDERWRLANPFRAGPAGGAGLELAYAADDDWEIAGGGAYRSYRFRLDDEGIAPGGIGENRFFPLFARVSRKLGAQTKLEFYAGVSAGGRLAVTDKEGDDTHSDYQTAPAFGVTLAHQF